MPNTQDMTSTGRATRAAVILKKTEVKSEMAKQQAGRSVELISGASSVPAVGRYPGLGSPPKLLVELLSSAVS